jgi:O-phospho-L-seryl-tRNASec:L-selenocysteinyl-tRNA synthase
MNRSPISGKHSVWGTMRLLLSFFLLVHMDKVDEEVLFSLVNQSYVEQGLQAIRSRDNLIQLLLSQKQLPINGWDDMTIEYFLTQLSMMDSNNFPSNIGVGEREGRIFSSLVSRRHYQFSHGIGRSGDIAEVQPKAAGSSLLYKLTNALVHHAIELSGFISLKKSLVLPMATGMALTLCLLTLKQLRPQAKYVIWSRIDQKSCFKCILTAGLIPIIIPTQLNSDEIMTNLPHLRETLCHYSSNDILCILTTTSCFAPRRPDCIDHIAVICQEMNIPHVINNAYGLQCPIIAKLVNRSVTIGRVDYIIQSTDKNFLVPIGGAVVSSPIPNLIDYLSKLYPGRASSAPILDLFITLLSMGQNGLKEIHHERQRCLPLLIDGLNSLTRQYEERVLISCCNTISIGITLSYLHDSPSYLGSMLFKRAVSGCRVVASSSSTPTVIGGYSFVGWGAHHDAYPTSYLTAACAVGIRETEIFQFLHKFEKVLKAMKTVSTIPLHIPDSNTTTAPDTLPSESETAMAPSTPTADERVISSESHLPLSSKWLEMMQRKAKHIG